MSSMSMSVPVRRFSALPVVLTALALALASLVGSVQAVAASSISPRELVPMLTRTGVGPDLTIIDVIYAPRLFFDATGIPVPEEMDAQPTLAFILQETVHDGELPLERAQAYLQLPDGERLDPYEDEVTAEDDHHRVSRLLFAQPERWPDVFADASGEPVLRLVVPMRDGSVSVANTYEWSVPIEIETGG